MPADADVPAELLTLVDGWNGLGECIVKKGNGARRNPLSKALLKGWKKVQREPELRDAYADIPKLLGAIRNAAFCHGESWFTLPSLFGQNKDGEWKVVKPLNGGYDESRRTLSNEDQKVIGTPAPLPKRSNRVREKLQSKRQS